MGPGRGHVITFTDLFAGAGGSSTGAAQVPGVEVRIAADHWAEAGPTAAPNPVCAGAA